jgi:hypothetical protein
MISILTPSRSRPTLAKRMMDSAKKTAGREIEIKFYLNDDDPDLEEYKSFLREDEYIVGPNQSTSYSWNLLAELAKYDIFFLVGDDVCFQTDNWVEKITNAFEKYPDKIVCVYPRAPSVSKYKSPHFCLHRNWINTLGFFLPPHFYHWYVDTWISEVAMKLGRFHLIADFELPIENIKDNTSSSYHNSWMRKKDDYIWKISERYRDADVQSLKKFIQKFKR